MGSRRDGGARAGPSLPPSEPYQHQAHQHNRPEQQQHGSSSRQCSSNRGGSGSSTGSILCLTRLCPPLLRLYCLCRCQCARVQVYYLYRRPIHAQSTLPTFIGAFRLLRLICLREAVDLVHCHQAFSTLGGEALLQARTMGYKASAARRPCVRERER